MTLPVRVGDVLHGFCNGFFGRDAYGEKVVIQVGPNWIVALEDDHPVTAEFEASWMESGEVPKMLRCWRFHNSLDCDHSCETQPDRHCPTCTCS